MNYIGAASGPKKSEIFDVRINKDFGVQPPNFPTPSESLGGEPQVVEVTDERTPSGTAQSSIFVPNENSKASMRQKYVENIQQSTEIANVLIPTAWSKKKSATIKKHKNMSLGPNDKFNYFKPTTKFQQSTPSMKLKSMTKF